MERYFAALALVGTLAIAAAAELNTRPAARVHVRYVDGVPMRFTSKLTRVVELNFTFNFHHSEGRANIDMLLDRMAKDYALGSDSAFSVKKFIGPGHGGSSGIPNPVFTLEDLQNADVIVANNISNLPKLPSISRNAASAFETAVRNGKSVLSFHGTDEGGPGWNFYSGEFLPWEWKSHGSQQPVPVYRNDPERNHVVLQNVLADSTRPMEVPMGIDSAGKEILRKDVPVRMIMNENNFYDRNLLADPEYSPLTTCLLRYDPRGQNYGVHGYPYAGGHHYAFILKVGKGKSAYFPFGHDNSELTHGASSFDRGLGDLERLYAQMLFFLAGYESEACGGAVDCEGLPVVDSLDRLTGKIYPEVTALFHPARSSVGFHGGIPCRATLMDLRGRIAATYSGEGEPRTSFTQAGLAPGVYFLGLSSGNAKAQVRRIIVPPSAP